MFWLGNKNFFFSYALLSGGLHYDVRSSVQLLSFCFEKLSVRKGYFNVLAAFSVQNFGWKT